MKKTMLMAVLTATASAFAVIAVSEAIANDDAVKADGDKPKHERKFKFDKDGDKKMSKQEYMDMQMERFGKMDADGDGFITREEMKNAREKARERFKKFHKDKDGKDGSRERGKGHRPPPPEEDLEE